MLHKCLHLYIVCAMPARNYLECFPSRGSTRRGYAIIYVHMYDVYTRMHTHAHAQTHAHAHTHTYTHTHTHTRTHTYTHTRARAHIHTHTHTHARTHTHTHTTWPGRRLQQPVRRVRKCVHLYVRMYNLVFFRGIRPCSMLQMLVCMCSVLAASHW